MAIRSGLFKQELFKTDSDGDKTRTSWWTSTETVDIDEGMDNEETALVDATSWDTTYDTASTQPTGLTNFISKVTTFFKNVKFLKNRVDTMNTSLQQGIDSANTNAEAYNNLANLQTSNIFVAISKNNLHAYCAEAGSFNIITLWYTKTTDVAGSGSYTTLGIPAHHYDDNEKVVGTWFGETLYERTFNGLTTNTNGDNWVNIGGIDATTWKDTVNVEIYCNSSDVNNKLTRIALGEARVFNGNVQGTTSVSYNRQINVATIQYTKTTD